ncbi:PadR family transcriptional regulator [Roseomonas sp. GC11]|uniref:PadR family transcriptional regulator n=1 Tax=Roseomonas sp. GC11 TaxID=2950546 RepID=UPI00210DDC3E|nr:PadR family transcriptional regulator [Roseomonas sp. GC11]MCQ4161458.1 PadR family transcriptional regulator [Roseomonas sp. GC11]
MRGFGREHGPQHGHRHGRPFGHGGLRLLLLHLVAEAPRHGYELIKAIEERMGGRYAPSPGVVYPTLTLLEELGHAAASEAAGGRRLYAATAAGRAFLAENQEAVAAVLARLGPEGRPQRPPQIARAIENLRAALHLRLAREPLGEAEIEAIAALLDATAKQVERT